MRRLSATVVVTLIALPAVAQRSVTFPDPLPSSFIQKQEPFGSVFSGGQRVQLVYAAELLGVDYPVRIQRLRFRRYSSSSTTTGWIHQAVCSLSTSPVRWNALTTSFANHVGKDVRYIFNGTLKANSTVWFIDFNLATPFLYDPRQGDLCFDIVRGIGGADGSGCRNGISTAPFSANRLVGQATSATGQLDSAATSKYGFANVCEVTFIPAAKLQADFTASPKSGESPLTVQFKDRSYSEAVGGVTSWAWDFDGDQVIDSTKQHPVHVFSTSRLDHYFDVSLTVSDSSSPASTLVKKACVRVNPAIAKDAIFGKSSYSKSAPGPVSMPSWRYSQGGSLGEGYGYYFQAPTNMTLRGAEVPNEVRKAQQTILVFQYPAIVSPPAGTYKVQPSDILLWAEGAPAGSVVELSSRKNIPVGTWIGVLGATHDANPRTIWKSFANSASTSFLGNTAELKPLRGGRFIGDKGLMNTFPQSGLISRVWLYLDAQRSALGPELSSYGDPVLGTTPQLCARGHLVGAQGSMLFLASGRAASPIPTAFGEVQIQPPVLLSLLLTGGAVDVPIAIPNHKHLKGLSLHWQSLVFDLRSGTTGMSNGVHWYLGTAQ